MVRSLFAVIKCIKTNKRFRASNFYTILWAIKTFGYTCNAACCISDAKKIMLVAHELRCLLNYSDDKGNFWNQPFTVVLKNNCSKKNYKS